MCCFLQLRTQRCGWRRVSVCSSCVPRRSRQSWCGAASETPTRRFGLPRVTLCWVSATWAAKRTTLGSGHFTASRAWHRRSQHSAPTSQRLSRDQMTTTAMIVSCFFPLPAFIQNTPRVTNFFLSPARGEDSAKKNNKQQNQQEEIWLHQIWPHGFQLWRFSFSVLHFVFVFRLGAVPPCSSSFV